MLVWAGGIIQPDIMSHLMMGSCEDEHLLVVGVGGCVLSMDVCWGILVCLSGIPCEGLTMLSWPTMVNHGSAMVANVTAGDTMVTGHGQIMLTWSCPGTIFTPSTATF